jgi:hypothetical protein
MNWLENYIIPIKNHCHVALYGHGMAIRCLLASLFDYEKVLSGKFHEKILQLLN